MTRPETAPRARSLRASINAFCRYCLVDPGSGGGSWREQVTACTARDCPLYPVRPLSKARPKPEKAAFDEKALPHA